MSKRFSKLFLKMFIPYMSVLMLALIITSIAYVTAFNVIENNALKMQESYLEQSKSVIDQRFRESVDASYQLRGLSSINAFKEKTYEEVYNDYYSVIELHNALRDVWFQSESIKGYFIFFKNSRVVANHMETYFYDSFNDEALRIDGMDKVMLWDEMFREYYAGEVFYAKDMAYYNNEFLGIPVVTTVGFGFDSPNAVIYMIINGDVIKESMTEFAENFQGNFYIVDENNQILMNLNENYGISLDGSMDEALLDHEAVVVKSTSDVYNYTYVLAQPRNAVFYEINALRKRALILIAVMMILGFFGSVLFARKNSAPMAKLMTNNELLTKKVECHIPYLRTTFLERWLRGGYSNQDEITAMTQLLKTDYSGLHYCVMVIDYDEHSSLFEEGSGKELKLLEMKRVQVKELILESLLEQVYVHDIDCDKLAVICINKGGTLDEFKEEIGHKATKCKELLSGDNLRDLHIGIGDVYPDMMDVSISLSNALDALTVFAGSEEENIFWFEDVGENSDAYYYPFELENRLFNCVRAGDSGVVTQIFRDLLNKNMVERNLSSQLMSAFIFDLYGTLNRVKERAISKDSPVKNIVNEAIDKMYECSDIEKIQLYKKTLVKISTYYESEKIKKQDTVIHRITTYIYDNLDNQDFCLQMVADEFSMSYKYASQLFKDHSQVSFSNYLQRIRMEEAEHLLSETQTPVNEIVGACGYNSSNTFGKAFKRFHGISASVFREKYRA